MVSARCQLGNLGCKNCVITSTMETGLVFENQKSCLSGANQLRQHNYKNKEAVPGSVCTFVEGNRHSQVSMGFLHQMIGCIFLKLALKSH